MVPITGWGTDPGFRPRCCVSRLTGLPEYAGERERESEREREREGFGLHDRKKNGESHRREKAL